VAAAPELLWTGAPGTGPVVALAHGVGAPMDSPFMNRFAEGLWDEGIPVVRFEFAYMRRRRTEGARSGPDPAPRLLEEWRTVIAGLDAQGISRRALVIGGKSMGGRMASMVADGEGVLALVCLGYPFHPPGKPQVTRVDHLASLQTPALFVQGTRDSLGSKEDVAGYRLPRRIRIHWCEDGDHSLKPRKASGRTEQQNLGEAIAATADFIRQAAATPRSL